MIVSIYLVVYIYRNEFGEKIGNGVPWKQEARALWSVAAENGPHSKVFTENGP